MPSLLSGLRHGDSIHKGNVILFVLKQHGWRASRRTSNSPPGLPDVSNVYKKGLCLSVVIFACANGWFPSSWCVTRLLTVEDHQMSGMKFEELSPQKRLIADQGRSESSVTRRTEFASGSFSSPTC